MKVLLADFDLFRAVGGGQTFYRGIIRRNPHIDFYYLRRGEAVDAARPANAHAIDYVEHYAADRQADLEDLLPPRWAYGAFDKANNIALSVAGRTFDVVDFPDYEQFGMFLAPAFQHHHVEYGRIVLSMHGRISTTISLNWQTEGKVDISVQMLEEMQYRAVDTRYFISRMYQEEWQALCDLDSCYVDPMWFFSFPKRRPYRDSSDPPDLNFIGRSEKRKGPHIFLQMAWWLPRGSFRSANIIGPEDVDCTGTSSSQHLRDIAAYRVKNVRFLPAKTPEELATLFGTKSITILPSQYDTLNLVALESLFAGCPTAIGDGAGVCRYLSERFPTIPFETIPVTNFYASIPRLETMLQDYKRYRDRLAAALERADVTPRGPGLENAYSSPPCSDRSTRLQLENWYRQLLRAVRRSCPEFVQLAAENGLAKLNPAPTTTKKNAERVGRPSRRGSLAARRTEDFLEEPLNGFPAKQDQESRNETMACEEA